MVGGLLSLPALDRYNDLVDDLPWLLAGEPEPVVVLNSNQRITFPLLSSAEARSRLGTDVADVLLKTPFLHVACLVVQYTWWTFFRPKLPITKPRAHVSAEQTDFVMDFETL